MISVINFFKEEKIMANLFGYIFNFILSISLMAVMFLPPFELVYLIYALLISNSEKKKLHLKNVRNVAVLWGVLALITFVLRR
jgi:hypothetical protein